MNDLTGVTAATEGRYVVAAGGCWNWIGTINKDGYPLIRFKYRQWRAHRLHFAFYKGALVPEMEIDHLCNNRRCVNPAHLEQVTSDENNRRAAERRGTCRRGHVRTPENLIWTGHSSACRECVNMRQRLRRQGKAE